MNDRIRLLIVDDNAEYVRLLAHHCRQNEEIEVVGTAADGEEAVHAIISYQPDVVLLDLVMPQLDGFGVMERIRRMDLKKRPTFVVMSAMASDRILRKTVDLGAIYFFIKPMDVTLVARRLVDLCTDSHGEAQAGSGVSQSTAALSKDLDVVPASDTLMANISALIQKIGVPPHIKGYQYIREAIYLVLEDMQLLNAVTVRLYPMIAQKYDTKPTRVERAIRHAIEVAWNRGDMNVLNQYFGYTIAADKGKPTNSEFIAMLADRIQMSM